MCAQVCIIVLSLHFIFCIIRFTFDVPLYARFPGQKAISIFFILKNQNCLSFRHSIIEHWCISEMQGMITKCVYLLPCTARAVTPCVRVRQGGAYCLNMDIEFRYLSCLEIKVFCGAGVEYVFLLRTVLLVVSVTQYRSSARV